MKEKVAEQPKNVPKGFRKQRESRNTTPFTYLIPVELLLWVVGDNVYW